MCILTELSKNYQEVREKAFGMLQRVVTKYFGTAACLENYYKESVDLGGESFRMEASDCAARKPRIRENRDVVEEFVLCSKTLQLCVTPVTVLHSMSSIDKCSQRLAVGTHSWLPTRIT